MTEIPEHLLKRSREKRAALGGGDGGESAGANPASPAPVAAAAPAAPKPAAAPAVAPAPKAPKPDPAYIRAAKTRQKMPFWAMSALGLLPVWAFLYLRGVQPEVKQASGPLAIGEEVYGGCQGCHGGAGEGTGAGRQFSNGEVLKTFPRIEDQLNFVYNGSQRFASANIAVYGNPNRPGGVHAPLSFGAAMPPQGEEAGGGLTELEILGVVCHERHVINDTSKDPVLVKEKEDWCSEEGEMFLAMETGEKDFSTIPEIGREPRAAKP